MDMLIQEMHHPRKLLRTLRDEYSSWVDRARAELEQKGEKETLDRRKRLAWQNTASLSNVDKNNEATSNDDDENQEG